MAAGERLKLLMESQKGKPNGVAGLNESGKVPSGQLPAMDYVPTSRKVNGKALTADITLSAADTGAIQVAEKGATGGVATLDDSGKVPREQLPAMNYDPAGSAEAVQDNLNAHTNDKNNPHGVTAQQVGADPAGSASAVQGNLNTHTSNKNNPHGVTAAQVGTYEAEKIMASGIPAMFGLGAGAAPSDVLAYVGKYAQHWWKRTKKTIKKSDSKERNISYSSESGSVTECKISYSSNINVSDGSLISPVNITVSYTHPTSVLNGKYFIMTTAPKGDTDLEGSKIYFGQSSVGTKSSGGIYYTYITCQLVSIETSEPEYVQSSDRSAYPDSGEQDGYEYQYLGIPFENAATAPKIATGSYVGTGKYGSSNPNSLTFEFAPKLLFITRSNGDGNFYGAYDIAGNPIDCSILTTIYTAGLGFATVSSGDALSGYARKSEDGRTISWYHRRNASSQANYSGYTYYYFAIG